VTAEIASVQLQAGSNSIAIRTIGDYSDSTTAYNGRNGQYIKAATLTQTKAIVECQDLDEDGDELCDVCGFSFNGCRHANVTTTLEAGEIDGTHAEIIGIVKAVVREY